MAKRTTNIKDLDASAEWGRICKTCRWRKRSAIQRGHYCSLWGRASKVKGSDYCSRWEAK